MAKSTSEDARPTSSRRHTWRAVVVGAAVPFAVLAAAPAVGAAETDTTQTVGGEQLPELPVPAPELPVPGGLDPTALLDLSQCLADLQAAIDAGAEVPAGSEEELEQLPLPVPDPGLPVEPPVELPDITVLNELCQDILATVTGSVPDVPDPGLPVPDPGLPVPLPQD